MADNKDVLLKIIFPIVESYGDEYYALIIVDSAGITHYWDANGDYSGFVAPPHVDDQTGSCLN